MPLVRINHPPGKPEGYREAISRGVQAALVATFAVPEDDRFQVFCEHPGAGLIVRTPSYLGVNYSDEFIIIQITVSDTRTVDQKKALFAAIADNLARDPGLRREDVFINLLEVKKENWSFGNGVAQYA